VAHCFGVCSAWSSGSAFLWIHSIAQSGTQALSSFRLSKAAEDKDQRRSINESVRQ
jgi:hypothetical protein